MDGGIQMIKEYKDFMAGYVYRCPLGDCTNGGASSKWDRLYVVRRGVTLRDVEEFCFSNSGYDVEQFFVVDYDFYESKNPVFAGYVRLLPLVKRPGAVKMAGGNYLESCDSRFKNFVCGCEYPVPIHDRWETR